MHSDHETLRRAEGTMAVEACRAAVDLAKCVDDLLAAGRALAELTNTVWGHPAIAAWCQAADAGAEALEVHEAYRQFEPTQWWA